MVTAASRDLEREALEARARAATHFRDRGRGRRRRASRALGQGRAARGRSQRPRSPPASRWARSAPTRAGDRASRLPSREACAVAAADGVSLDPAGQWAIIEGLPHDLTTSAARDAAAGRPTELDAITGSVVRAARRLGIAAPDARGAPRRGTRPGWARRMTSTSVPDVRARAPVEARRPRGDGAPSGSSAGSSSACRPPMRSSWARSRCSATNPSRRTSITGSSPSTSGCSGTCTSRSTPINPPDPARRPCRARDRPARTARDAGGRRSGHPRRADACARRDRAPAVPPRA